MPADVFTARFHPRIGDTMVTGSTFIGILIILIAAMRGQPEFGVLALCAFGVALYHLPMSQSGAVQLQTDRNGITVDGLGFIGWSDIADIDYLESYLRSLPNATLTLTLSRPLRAAVRRVRNGNPLRFLMATIYKIRGDRTIVLRLQGLKEEPELIRDAVGYFFTQSRHDLI